jgi:hypothetical protein
MLECAQKKLCVCARALVHFRRAQTGSMLECEQKINYVCVSVHAGERRRPVIRVRRSTLATLERASPVEYGEGVVTTVVSGEVGEKGATQGGAQLVGAALEGATQAGKCAAANPVVYGEGKTRIAQDDQPVTAGDFEVEGATQGRAPLVGAPQEGSTQGGKQAAATPVVPCEGAASDSGVGASQDRHSSRPSLQDETVGTASDSGVSTPQEGDEQVDAEGTVHAGVDATVHAATR